MTGYPEELRDFVGAISSARAPKSDLMLACDTLILVYAAYLSAEQGRMVELGSYLL